MSATVSTSSDTDGSAGSIAVVERFLDALQRFDVDEATALLAEDARWVNVGWPTVEGRDAVVSALQRIGDLPGAAFTVRMHSIAADGDTVLTERTDGLYAGPIGGEFWVCGTFQLRDGQIVEWRDRFDHLDLTRGVVVGTVRGLLRTLGRR